MREPSERSVERYLVGLRYLSSCITPESVTTSSMKRDPALIAVTSGPTPTTHTGKRHRMRFVNIQYRKSQ
jgi:hypothetical protein